MLVLLTTIAGAFVILVRINLQFDQPQGRYLFPALPAIALMIAIGLESWRVPARLTVGALAAANALILLFVVIPAYPPNVPTISKALAQVHAQHANGEWFARRAHRGGGRAFRHLRSRRGTPPSPPTPPLVQSRAGESPDVQGEAVVTLDSRDITLPFSWLSDGQRRTIYLTLLPHAPAGTRHQNSHSSRRQRRDSASPRRRKHPEPRFLTRA